MNQQKILCELCGAEISKSQWSKHERRHRNHPETFKPPRNTDPTKLNCCYCNKLCKNLNSLAQHEIRCKSNPDKINVSIPGFNMAGTREAWNKGLTAADDERVANQQASIRRWHETHTANFGGYIPTSARKCKYGTYKGFYCDSGWELAFLIYNLDHGNNIERCVDYFEYTYNDKVHKYYPDFIIDGIYYEIKGIYRPEDSYKIDQFPENKKLVVIDSNNIYKFTKYCESTYGKNFTYLYDRRYPSWMDKHDETKNYNFNLIE